jgi:hypothetical protein
MTGQRPDKKMILRSNESRGFLKTKGDFLGAEISQFRMFLPWLDREFAGDERGWEQGWGMSTRVPGQSRQTLQSEWIYVNGKSEDIKRVWEKEEEKEKRKDTRKEKKEKRRKFLGHITSFTHHSLCGAEHGRSR